MNLQFAEYINDWETRFEDKICLSLIDSNIEFTGIHETTPIYLSHLKDYDKLKPKIHTIREDKKNRWKKGKLIHFKKWFGRPYHSKNIDFAPTMPVISTQKIELKFYRNTNKLLMLLVDDKSLELSEIHKLAINDGFEDIESMIAYLGRNFTGKIIHWTDFSYQ